MAKAKTEYTFVDGTKLTPRIVPAYCNVKKPDDEYNTYAVMMVLPKEDPFTKALFKDTLALENERRDAIGAERVKFPSNWLKDGKPSVNEDGSAYVVKAVMKAENSNGDSRRPKLYNARAVEDYTIDIWGGDTIRVEFSVGVWTRGSEAGSKYFLRSVQLIEEGPREGSKSNPFSDESTKEQETTDAASDDSEIEDYGDDEDVPF